MTPTPSERLGPSILVAIKDELYCSVEDYRGNNRQLDSSFWLLPGTGDVIDALEGIMFFFRIDLTSGCIQIALENRILNMTSIIFLMDLYKWMRLPVGQASAPGAKLNLREVIYSSIPHEVSLVSLGDTILYGKTFEEHLLRWSWSSRDSTNEVTSKSYGTRGKMYLMRTVYHRCKSKKRHIDICDSVHNKRYRILFFFS